MSPVKKITDKLAIGELPIPEDLLPTRADLVASDAEGIIDSGYHFSKELLGLMIRRLTATLREQGVESGSRIGVALPNCWQWFVVNGAIRLLDAVHVALNGRTTSKELNYMAGDSSCRTVLTLDTVSGDADGRVAQGFERLVSAAPGSAESAIDLFELIAGAHSEVRDDFPKLGATSIVVYTSGTTGRPKGAFRPAFLTTSTEFAEYRRESQYLPVLGERGYRRVLLCMPFHHSSGLKQAAPILSGPALGIIQRRFDARQAVADIAEFGISDWSTVPTMLQRVLALSDDELTQHDLTSLKKVTVGAAPVTPELMSRFDRHFGEHLLFQNYGCTETGAIAGLTPQDRAQKPGVTGRPFTHVDIKIRGAEGNELPTGESGEIWARTPQVITRYMGRGPLGPEDLDSAGRFRTGDLGRLDEDGLLTVTGRAKELIITGGTNIYPNEVETVLKTCDGVADAAVVGIPDEELGEIARAYLEAEPGAVIDQEALDVRMRELLAGYKVPRSYVVVDALPRNHMGKIVKGSLTHSDG